MTTEKIYQVRVYQIKEWDGELRWTVFPKEEDKKHIKDKFFVTLHMDRDEVFSQQHAEETVEKWIGIRQLQHVPLTKIMHVLRNEIGWGPPLLPL